MPHRAASLRLVLALFGVCMLMVLAIGWTNDHNSCQRQKGVRDGLNAGAAYFDGQAVRSGKRAEFDTGPKRALDLEAIAAARQAADRLRVPVLTCSFPFPTTH